MQPQIQDIQKQAEVIQAKVNTLSQAQQQGLQVDKETTVQDAQSFLNQRIPNPTPITYATPSTVPSLPAPTAPTVETAFVSGIADNVESKRALVDTNLATERTRVQSEIQRLEAERTKILEKDIKPLTDPFREKLETAERERLFVNQNFEANQRIVNEMESLLTDSQRIIDAVSGKTRHTVVANAKMRDVLRNHIARLGILESVFNARNNQIASAYQMIDRSFETINADRQDRLAYFNVVLGLHNSKILTLSKEDEKYADKQRQLIQRDLERAEATADYVKSLMINPQTAQFMADAGVTLNDSIEEINTKMGQQAERDFQKQYTQKMTDFAIQNGFATPEQLKSLELVLEPTQKLSIVQNMVAKGTRDQLLLERMAKEASIQASRASTSNAILARRKALFELALVGDPNAIKELGFDPGAEMRAQEEGEKRIAVDKEVERLDNFMDDVKYLLNNRVGLTTSTGDFKNATISGFLGGQLLNQQQNRNMLSKTIGVTPVVGNIVNAVSARNSKRDWLGTVDKILSQQGFDALIAINERVRLTPITENEVRLAFNTASELNARAIRDENGKLLGFDLSEQRVEELLNNIITGTQKIQAEIIAINKFGMEGYLRLVELEKQYATQ